MAFLAASKIKDINNFKMLDISKKCYMKKKCCMKCNSLMNLKNSGDSTGFEPMTSAMPVQCSNQLLQSHTAGQFVGLMFSRERNVV